MLCSSPAFPLKRDIYSEVDPNRKYNEVVWLVSHNSAFNYPAGWSIVNQTKSIKDQMENHGVRGLMLDIFYSDLGPTIFQKREKPEVVSCHGECEITRDVLRILQWPRKLSKIFEIIKNFLAANRKEIVTLLIEDYVPSENRDELVKILDESGLRKYFLDLNDTKMFKKNPVVQWPSIGQLRSRNKRLIMFSPKAGPFLSQWSWTVENHYNMGETKGENCEKRGESRSRLVRESKTLLNINHFYDFAFDTHLAHIPAMRMINHGYQNGPLLEKYLDKCIGIWKRVPNFISVDHANRHKSIYGGIELYDLIKKLNKRPVKDFYADQTVYNAIYPGGHGEGDSD